MDMRTRKKPSAQERKALFVRLPAEEHTRIKVLAARRQQSVGELVREALTRYLRTERH